jgi:phosphoribosylamine--glycine ligase
MTPALRDWLTREVAQKVVDGMRAEGHPFTGILFCGMMMTERNGQPQPMVLEFNTRFGDPETQAILIRMETDVLNLFEAAIGGYADRSAIKMKPGAGVCVVLASGGYPGKVQSGKEISGLGHPSGDDVVVFHSGTALKNDVLITAGGRVLGVTAFSPAGLEVALTKAYAAIEPIKFEGMQFRRDIGWRALAKEQV